MALLRDGRQRDRRGRYPDTDSNSNANSFTHPDTGPDRSRPGAERLYQVGRGNRR